MGAGGLVAAGTITFIEKGPDLFAGESPPDASGRVLQLALNKEGNTASGDWRLWRQSDDSTPMRGFVHLVLEVSGDCMRGTWSGFRMERGVATQAKFGRWVLRKVEVL